MQRQPQQQSPVQTPRLRYGWTITAFVVATGLYVAALRTDFYQLTSPFELPWHITLRKIYSVGAFALVAFLARKALTERGLKPTPRLTIFTGALFSGAIEIGQYYAGSQEGLVWNAIDVGCGALGGLASMVDLVLRKKPARQRPRPLLRRRSGDLREKARNLGMGAEEHRDVDLDLRLRPNRIDRRRDIARDVDPG